MSVDLERELRALALRWDDESPAIDVAEVMARTGPREFEPIDDPIELDVVAGRPPRRASRVLLAVACVVVFVAAGVAVAQRVGDDVEPVAPTPVTTVTPSTTAAPSTVPTTSATTSTVEPSTVAPSTAPPTSSPAEIEARLAEIDTARLAALRTFTQIGFHVVTTLDDPSGPEGSPREADVVLRNDGSAAITSADGSWSSYDATTGNARTGFTALDGTAGYQEIAGMTDNSVALGVPTGLPNGIVEQFPLYADDVTEITDDVVDGRAAWRIVRVLTITPEMQQTTTTWIDQQLGVTIRTVVTAPSGNDPTVMTTQTTELSRLEIGAEMPATFPGTFPDGAVVQRSGTPRVPAVDVIGQAAAAFGEHFLLPSIAPDTTSLTFMNAQPDGTGGMPWFEARWFDGFTSTVLRIAQLTDATNSDASCPDCTGSMLDELVDTGAADPYAIIRRDGVWINFTGPDPARIRELIAAIPRPDAA
ncbi:MAG: hypothetical protein U0Q03_10885 [Acidimicrobiales bacterium]